MLYSKPLAAISLAQPAIKPHTIGNIHFNSKVFIKSEAWHKAPQNLHSQL